MPTTIGLDPTTISTRTLVFGMARPDGSVRAAELYPVAEACGQTTEQVRSCLRRVVADGFFVRTGEGRAAVYEPTESGRAATADQLERHRLALTQDQAGRGWDRQWHLVGFAVPETRRDARDALRGRLRAFGGAPIQNGLFVSTHGWEDRVLAVAERLGVTDHVTTARTDDLVVGGERDPRALAARLWDLEEIADRYDRFIDRYRDVPEALEAMRVRQERLPDTDFLAGALAAVLDFQACFRHDPLLAPELLPRPWPGRDARRLMVRVRRLGVLAREQRDGPALFGELDEVLGEHG